MRCSVAGIPFKGNTRWKLFLLAAAAASVAGAGMMLAACGGGGGDAPAATTTTVTGSVFAAPVNGASVTVKYADNNATVAGPVTTGADGAYNVSIPNGALSKALRFESSGGTFTDEATGTLGVTAGRLAAYAPADTLRAGSAVHLTPASTIVSDLVVAHGKTFQAANTIFNTEFGFTDNVSVAPKNDNAAGTSDAQKLAALRAVAFSQLTEDMGLQPADQFLLLSRLAADLSDNVLNGVQGGTALSVGSTPLREDIRNRFSNALARCWGDSPNKTGLTADKIGAPPFAKVAYTNSYRIEYIDGMMQAAQGKTTFKIRVTQHDNVTPIAGLAYGDLTPYPYMHMATKSHTTPLDNAVTESPGGSGIYECTVYYLMSTEMSGMSMGFWELGVTVNGQTATLFPYVGMAMGTDTVRMTLKGQNDNIAVMGMGSEQRTYYVFRDKFSGMPGNHTFGIFLAAKESMMAMPALVVGSTLHDENNNHVTVDNVVVQASTDNGATWLPATSSSGPRWEFPGLTGFQAGTSKHIWLRFFVNGEQKTTNGSAPSGTNEYADFTVTPM